MACSLKMAIWVPVFFSEKPVYQSEGFGLELNEIMCVKTSGTGEVFVNVGFCPVLCPSICFRLAHILCHFMSSAVWKWGLKECKKSHTRHVLGRGSVAAPLWLWGKNETLDSASLGLVLPFVCASWSLLSVPRILWWPQALDKQSWI